ncbi:hypothetical protein M5E87_04180 [Flavonifractor plautii]|nr:hypothetical protein M5E87_04180 [Flavonifractor plautii]
MVLKMEQGGDSGVHIKTVLLTVSGEENPERPEPEGPTEEAVYAAIMRERQPRRCARRLRL